MTGSFWMDWAILAVSLFNTILLFWLGLMVLLNTEKRTWGVILSGGAMLLGGVFFLSHTAIVGYSPFLNHPELEAWWRAGWVPVTCLPFVWYAVMLWYSGYWEPDSALHKRHRIWFRATLVWAAVFLVLLIFTHPLPSVAQVLNLDFTATPAVYGVPVLILLYPLYTVLCTSLTLDVLRWPEPSRRALGEQARARARPWLGAASLALFAVGLLVGGTVFWVVASARMRAFEVGMALSVGILDLIIASLIGAAILLLGQAIVAYEVFTVATLPRRGLRRSWRRAIILALGYSPLVSLAILLEFRPVNILLIATLLITVFYALLSWRSFGEREHLMNSLRPFLASQDLYAELISQTGDTAGGYSPERTAGAAFRALCSQVLETRLGYLIPLGALAPLAGPPLAYPESAAASLPASLDLDLATVEPAEATHPWLEVDPQRGGGATWAIPLYGRQGPVGALLLGEKRGNGLYTQEEIEIARLAGERLLDALASAEIARRLMALQRQRIAESQVLDRRARRVLHDEALPQLHAVLLRLSDSNHPPDPREISASLTETHRQIAGLLRELPPAPAPQVARLGLAQALETLIQQEHRSDFDQVAFEITPEARERLASLPPLSSEVVYFAAREAVRNAARYGRGGASEQELRLSLKVQWEGALVVTIEDNGVGLPPYAGLTSATQGASDGGSGQGLALHSTLLAVLGGTLEVFPTPGGGASVTIRLPPGVRQ